MIIDAHQHFWRFRPERDTWITDEMSVIQRDFLPEDLKSVFQQNKVEGCVAVQADQSEKETEFLLACAREHSFVKGIVGWTDLRSPHVQARLEYYHQFEEVKGFRHIVQGEPTGFLLSKNFCDGIEKLEAYDFTYDILIYAKQLPEAIEFGGKFPRQKFVVDHLAKPDIRHDGFDFWKKHLAELAKHENVYCKLSGLVTEAIWKEWTYEILSPYLETAFELFGPRRLMYGSDWPVCLLAATYAQQFEVINRFIGSLPPTEKKMILRDNAVRFYHL